VSDSLAEGGSDPDYPLFARDPAASWIPCR